MKRTLASLALFLFVASASARVFWTLGGGASSGLLNADEANWTRAYSAPLRINGGRAEIGVWGTAQSVDEAMAVLRQRAQNRGGAMYAVNGGELAWGVACVGDRVLRFLISAGPGRYCHIFQLEQSYEEFHASRVPPATAGLPDVPEIPEARVSQVLAVESSGLTLASEHTATAPAVALHQINELLAGAGWGLMMPAGGQAGVYVRGRDLLVVNAVSSGGEGETLLTLAHKRRVVLE